MELSFSVFMFLLIIFELLPVHRPIWDVFGPLCWGLGSFVWVTENPLGALTVVYI